MMYNTFDICKLDLFTDKNELLSKYTDSVVDRIIRIRHLYNYFLANPSCKDRQLISELTNSYNISRSAAYCDLAIVKSLLPFLTQATKEFHRWRFNEMTLRTFQLAEKRKDVRTMERIAASYAKFNSVDKEDNTQLSYEVIAIQPFTATDDPTVLGIKPIPNLNEKIASLIKKYSSEVIDIEDVQGEDVDLELNELFDDEK